MALIWDLGVTRPFHNMDDGKFDNAFFLLLRLGDGKLFLWFRLHPRRLYALQRILFDAKTCIVLNVMTAPVWESCNAYAFSTEFVQ